MTFDIVSCILCENLGNWPNISTSLWKISEPSYSSVYLWQKETFGLWIISTKTFLFQFDLWIKIFDYMRHTEKSALCCQILGSSFLVENNWSREQMDMGMGWTRTLISGNISPTLKYSHAIIEVKSLRKKNLSRGPHSYLNSKYSRKKSE